jgi:methionyl aminopeptidase
MARRRGVPPVPIKDARAQASMRRAGRIVALAIAKVGEALRPGVTTAELDAVAEQTIRGLGGVPAFLGYRGYPATACLSVNQEVVHGIPGPRPLREGDILGVDLGATVEGWIADAAYTFPVGAVPAETTRLLEAGQGALAAGIAAARVGNRVRDIGAAIDGFASAQGYTVVRDLCGHGVGRSLHEAPQVPNYAAPDNGVVLRAGMALAIEPMVNAGGAGVRILNDGWTFVTSDGSLSVHFEHTVLIQPEGPEIITLLR